MNPAKKNRSKQNTGNSSSNINDDPNINYNKLFGPAFMNVIESGRRIFMLFSGTDRLTWEFEEKFYNQNQDKISPYKHLLEYHVVDKANHILSEKEWQDELLSLSTNWLSTNP